MSVKPLTKNERRWFLVCAALVISGVLALLYVFMNAGLATNVTYHGTTSPEVSVESQDLTGNWTAQNNGVKLEATVVNDTIKIVMKNNDVTMDWWQGSFASSAKVGDAIASIRTADPNVVTVNSEKTTVFTVGNGTLTFDMSFMSIIKTVKLTHV